MTRDEIYDHLAQVYLGKRKKADEKKRIEFNAWLVINILITAIIFSSAFYGLTAFLKQRDSYFESKIVYALHNGRIFFDYDFKNDAAPLKKFSLIVPQIDAGQYASLHFSLRAKEEGNPGIVKVVIQSNKNEVASYYVQGISHDWKEYDIPLSAFKQISNWSDLKDISFVLESWNINNVKGVILIDDVRFSSAKSS
jgi:hypothetical protein